MKNRSEGIHGGIVPESKERPVIIGVTAGDPAGIGPEIVVRACRSEKIREKVRLVIFSDRAVLDQTSELLSLPAKWCEIRHPGDIKNCDTGIPYVDGQIIHEPVAYGRLSALCGRAAYTYFSMAIDWALKGYVDGIATAPIQKEALRMGGCDLLDHTTILKEKTRSLETTTLFVTGELRIFFLTRHIPLRDVADALSEEEIYRAIGRCRKFLKTLGIREPKLAVAALNPHGGEDGMFGEEERRIIRPAIERARDEGEDVAGPVPADAVFNRAKEGHYDGVLSLYHDQGHIAAKTLDFYRTVSFTMGLPFLRTSVDHGTAFDIAGKGEANVTSMEEAILAAADYSCMVRENSK